MLNANKRKKRINKIVEIWRQVDKMDQEDDDEVDDEGFLKIDTSEDNEEEEEENGNESTCTCSLDIIMDEGCQCGGQ